MKNEELLQCQKCGSKGELCLPTKKIIKNERTIIKIMVMCPECGYTWFVDINELSTKDITGE